jgi:hypothetical protein
LEQKRQCGGFGFGGAGGAGFAGFGQELGEGVNRRVYFGDAGGDAFGDAIEQVAALVGFAGRFALGVIEQIEDLPRRLTQGLDRRHEVEIRQHVICGHARGRPTVLLGQFGQPVHVWLSPPPSACQSRAFLVREVHAKGPKPRKHILQLLELLLELCTRRHVVADFVFHDRSPFLRLV